VDGGADAVGTAGRGLGVAADLQMAEIHWVAAQNASVLRYATGATNEASHRLGARDGINLVAAFRAWWWSATGSADDDDEPSAFDVDVREDATRRRQAALHRLAGAGLVIGTADADQLWQLIDADPTFAAGQRQYEPRSWAMQELTAELFQRHVVRGEVITEGSDAVAILVNIQLPAEDSALRLALLVGAGAAAAGLVARMHDAIGESFRFRVPRDSAMMVGHEQLFRDAGFVSPEWELHLLARPMDSEHPIPALDARHVVLADAPAAVTPPRW